VGFAFLRSRELRLALFSGAMGLAGLAAGAPGVPACFRHRPFELPTDYGYISMRMPQYPWQWEDVFPGSEYGEFDPFTLRVTGPTRWERCVEWPFERLRDRRDHLLDRLEIDW
jgi:hypothetical protein